MTIANLVMVDVKARALAMTASPLLLEVVDDMCTALPAHKLQELLDHLNGVEPSIQFTVETELKGKHPFLDFLLQRA